MKKRIYHWNDDKIHDSIAQEFHKDRPIITSTDTVFGFLAPLTRKSYEQLNRLKKRTDKPYLVLLDHFDSVSNFCPQLTFQIEEFLKKIWPGPVTVLLPVKKEIPAYVTGKKETIAIRVPDHEQLRRLAREYHGLFSTSANTAGKPIPQSINEIEPELMQQVNLIINEQQIERPSTIIDLTGQKPVVIREGAVSTKEIEELFKGK